MSSTTSHRHLHLIRSATGTYKQLHYDTRVNQQDVSSTPALVGHASSYDTSSSTPSTPTSTWTNSPSLVDTQYGAAAEHAYLEEQLHWEDDSVQDFLVRRPLGNCKSQFAYRSVQEAMPSLSHSNQVMIPGQYESTGWSPVHGPTTPYGQPDQSRLVDFDMLFVSGSKPRTPEAIEKRKRQNRKA
jgi:hypothetical protein